MSRVGPIRTIVARVRDEHLTFYASSIAYFAFFSIVPALLLITAVGSLVGGESIADLVVSAIGDQLSSEGRGLVSDALEDGDGQVGASLVGLVGLLWGAIKVVRSIDVAFDRIYAADVVTSLPRQLLNGVAVLVLVGLGVAIMVGVGAVLRAPDRLPIPFIGAFGALVLLVGLVVVFLPVYYLMPPKPMTVGAALPGAVVAALGWLVLQFGFQAYTSIAGDYAAYGLLGAVLLFLLWLYLGGVVLLVGGTINAVLEEDLEWTGPSPASTSRL